MSETTTPQDDSQLEEFVALLAMLPTEEHYAVAIDFIEIAENHDREIGSE
jgi:hypothetical protein